MTIENPVAYLNGIWDWKIFEGCFGITKIKPTDIDGLVERHGFFLVFEAKQLNVPVKAGQEIMFNALINTKKFTVFVLWGEQNKPEEMQIFYSSIAIANYIGWGFDKKKATLEDVRRAVKLWFSYVDTHYFIGMKNE